MTYSLSINTILISCLVIIISFVIVKVFTLMEGDTWLFTQCISKYKHVINNSIYNVDKNLVNKVFY